MKNVLILMFLPLFSVVDRTRQWSLGISVMTLSPLPCEPIVEPLNKNRYVY